MSIISKVRSAISWFSVSANRKKAYKVTKFLIPLAVAGGFLSSGQAAEILTAVGVVLGFAVPHLADKNTDA